MAVAAQQWGGPRLHGEVDDGGEEEDEDSGDCEVEAGRRGGAGLAPANTPPLPAEELTRQLAAALMPDRASETRCGFAYFPLRNQVRAFKTACVVSATPPSETPGVVLPPLLMPSLTQNLRLPFSSLLSPEGAGRAVGHLSQH